jgi:DNA-binding GntR family transcriptional regulator
MVFSGAVRPGQRLPLQEIAAALGVSTTPVREGLLTLEKEGLVESERHRGFHVAQFSRRDVLDVYELHAFVAATLAERAAANISDRDLDRLAAFDQQIRLAVTKHEADEVEYLNFQFHRLINAAAPDSAQMRRFLRGTSRFVPRHVYKGVPGWLDASAQDHEAILDALRQREGPAAAAATRRHILNAGSLLVDYLVEQQLWQ